MEDERKFASIHWEDEIRYIVACDRIVNPRKDQWMYKEGEYITAKYFGKEYRAVISEISTDKFDLNNRKRDTFPLKHCYDAAKDPKNTMHRDSTAHAEPNLDVTDHHLQQSCTVRNPAALRHSIQTKVPTQAHSTPTKVPTQAQSKKRAYVAMMVNSRGHQTVAQKQPRWIPPPPSAVIDAARACPTPPLEERHQHAANGQETMHCLNCIVMASRIKFLEQELLKFQKESDVTGAVTAAVTIPKPGIYTPEKGAENNMVRLIDSAAVYLYKHQKDEATQKGGQKRDGKRIARFLMPIFFNRAERLAGTVSRQSSGPHAKLNPVVIDAIVEFASAFSHSSKGECRDAIANQLSSMRANEGKATKIKQIN